jgi:PAS domain S-box-containing protein
MRQLLLEEDDAAGVSPRFQEAGSRGGPANSGIAPIGLFLSTTPAQKGERRIAFALVVLSAAAFIAAVPFARVPLPVIPGFIPAYEAALALNDLITAVLLIGQLKTSRSLAFLALACGYFFDAAMIVPHALTFPGLFSDAGLLGAGAQTTAWIYMFWHGGFPLFVILYSSLKRRTDDVDQPRPSDPLRVGWAIATVLGAATALTLLATAGQSALPAIMAGDGYTASMRLVVSLVWALSLVALLMLWRARQPSVLDLWLAVVMCAWLFDIALSAVLNAGRFDLGFYAGRVYGLLAASFVLVTLLLDTSRLHVRLAGAQSKLEDYAHRLEEEIDQRTAEIRLSNEGLRSEVIERRQAEQELLQTRAFLNVIIESIPLTVIVKDAKEGRYVLVNRAGEELLGHDRTEIVGRKVHDFLPEAEAEKIDEHDRRVVASRQPYEAPEHSVTTRDRGTRLVRKRIVPVLDEQSQPQYVLGIVEDVTEQRQTEAQLHHAQKMEAIGTLTGGMAHDFNNLLSVVIGNLDVLRGFVKENATVDELAGEALDAALRGADLTRRLLAFARRQPLQPARVDINELVDGITRLLTRTLGEQIEIDVRLAPELWPVTADPSQLEAALTNLATNARDAMPNGGRLTISTSQRTLDADYASLHPEVTPGEFAMIEVTDTGTGMPPEVLGRIFEPFFTTKESDKGTGLGLSMVFGFIKQSGGHINVYSEPGVGTTFRLYLPRAKEGGEVDRRTVIDEEPHGERQIVLAVEDNAPLRRIVVRQLLELGYRPLEAENAAAALAILEREHVDLLFSDIIMPGEVSGLELARVVVKRWPHIRVLLTSGFPGTKLVGSLGEAATAQLLSKPYRKLDLARALHAVFAASAAIAEA